MNKIKRFFKELKRVRWPKAKEAKTTFFSSMTFIIIASLALFAVAIIFAGIWSDWGVGLNG